MATEVSKRGKREVSSSAENLVDLANAYLAGADIYISNDNLFLRLDVPGVEKGNVQIEVDEADTLQVRAKNSLQEPQGEVTYREFAVGDYYRSFRLGEEYDKDRISAQIGNGILEITVPKREEVKPRRIEIKA